MILPNQENEGAEYVRQCESHCVIKKSNKQLENFVEAIAGSNSQVKMFSSTDLIGGDAVQTIPP